MYNIYIHCRTQTFIHRDKNMYIICALISMYSVHACSCICTFMYSLTHHMYLVILLAINKVTALYHTVVKSVM